MWWKPKLNCFFAAHVATPDREARLRGGMVVGTHFTYYVRIYPSRDAWRVAVRRYCPEVPNPDHVRGFVLGGNKRPPHIFLPVFAPDAVVIHEAVHAAVHQMRLRGWSPFRKEEALAMLTDCIACRALEDRQHVRRALWQRRYSQRLRRRGGPSRASRASLRSSERLRQKPYFIDIAGPGPRRRIRVD